MRYASIRDIDVSNGIGIAASIFVQGCTHHCKGCFNPSTWSFEGGKEFTEEVQDRFLEICKNENVDCVSVLGGEPLDQDEELYKFLLRLKNEIPNKPVFLWTGYTWEFIEGNGHMYKLVKDTVDVLIDGEYIENKRDFRLKLRGSSNQRIIMVKETISSGKIVLMEDV